MTHPISEYLTALNHHHRKATMSNPNPNPEEALRYAFGEDVLPYQRDRLEQQLRAEAREMQAIKERPVIAAIGELTEIVRGIAEALAKLPGRDAYALAPTPADASPTAQQARADALAMMLPDIAYTDDRYIEANRRLDALMTPVSAPDVEADNAQLRARLDRVIEHRDQVEGERDGAYRERAQLLAWLATIHPAVIAPAPDIDEDGWQILYLTPGGNQLSWHIAPRDAELMAHVEHVPADDPRAQWDGHTTEQKYERIRSLTILAEFCTCTYDQRCASCEANGPLTPADEPGPADA
jgi:hypothetical protein